MAAAAGSSRVLPALMILTGVFFLLVAPGSVAAGAAAAPPAGLEFRVGGPRGWRVPDANTSYDWWAMNNRFHVDFQYANDSVLVVDRLAFDACNASELLAAFADGATKFRLDRPGFFCFISGEAGHCEEGQRRRRATQAVGVLVLRRLLRCWHSRLRRRRRRHRGGNGYGCWSRLDAPVISLLDVNDS
ncbi:early nodulin-like protein 7 [Miscanthus floridulus]|uniref:early nodulin-like protein 7 n=1 Tax=Miscanthus floridulus TaxID=154761 RepID=UPI003458DC50